MKMRTYSELFSINSFEDRFNYLKLSGLIGNETFGFDRYVNQRFYNSREWKRIRDKVIIRDSHNGSFPYDMSFYDYRITGPIFVHHMNPITVEDFENGSDILLDPEFLVCVCATTHNAIHFGDDRLLPKLPIERRKGDTTLW